MFIFQRLIFFKLNLKSIYDLIGLNDKKPTEDGQKPDNDATNEDGIKESAISRTEQIFLRMDFDKNGVITESEFIQGCLQDRFLQQILTADYSESI